MFELIDILSYEKKKSERVEKGKSERRRNSSLLGEVNTVQPNTSSPPHSQPGVAKATLTLCEPHSKQVERRESCCVCTCIISALQGACVCVCARVYDCMCACLNYVYPCVCDQMCEYAPLVSRLSVSVFWF